MEEYPLTQKVIESNKTKTSTIRALWVGSFITIVYSLLTSIIPRLRNGDVATKEITIFFLLLLFSVLSLLFYFKIIQKLKETKYINELSSYLLSGLLLVVLIASLVAPFFSYIGLGLIFISLKSFSLWRESSSKQIGPVTTRYFRNIFYTYLILSIISLIVGYKIDNNQIPLFTENKVSQNYALINNELKTLDINNNNQISKIKENIDLIYNELNDSLRINSTLYLSLVILFLFLVIYIGFKMIILKKIKMEDIFKELEVYYEKSK